MRSGTQSSDGETEVPFLNSSSCTSVETDWAASTAQREGERTFRVEAGTCPMSGPSSAWQTTSFPGSCPCTCSVLGQQESDKTVPQRSAGETETPGGPRPALVCVRSLMCGPQKGVGARRSVLGGRNQLGQAEGQGVEEREDRSRSKQAQKSRPRM